MYHVHDINRELTHYQHKSESCVEKARGYCVNQRKATKAFITQSECEE